MKEVLKKLKEHSLQVSKMSLKTLLADPERNKKMTIEFDKILFDFSHEKMTIETMKLLQDLADKADVMKKIQSMFKGVFSIP